ncbi:type III pantothenate kinase [Steroidobacter sp.]|uniref:type III pantothenate kinase n=1 Tax=Steroidobacter sp. TaxID=1978227 RepID=UPI001A395E3B|nr:type III pantothenate kinase [Steroidobacter sp.]MBL8270348.1 type III pantothenate kinase [Steroidobacter sp.]
MLLLIDIGNTRIKWARSGPGGLSEQSAAVHADWTRDDFIQQILNSGPRAQRVFIANVGGKRMGALAQAAIAEAWQIEPRFVQSPAAQAGLHNAYPEPAKLGVDRWLALLGGRAIEPRPLCVVSVGTAMTIDGLDANGQHLGGVIVPGPDLMVSSLLKNTSDIAQRTAGGQTRDALFADNTLGAIQQGAVHALAALVERSLETLEKQLGQRPVLLLTGGASPRILGAIRAAGREIPDLVLRGLAVVAALPESAAA